MHHPLMESKGFSVRWQIECTLEFCVGVENREEVEICKFSMTGKREIL